MLTHDDISPYLRDIERCQRMTHEETCQCARDRDAGDPTAVNRLTTGNLPLVVSIAKRYRWSGVQLCDLVQAGNRGLMRAAKGFDPARGLKFSTYASGWIRQACGRAAHNLSATIHIPDYMRRTRGLPRAITQTDAESCASVADKDGCDFLDYVGGGDDPGFAAVDRQDDQQAKLEAIGKAITHLRGRTLDVVQSRIRGETLVEIGSRYGLSREMVRQIEVRGMQTVRAIARVYLKESQQ